jgi:Ran GTPase-activating protein (RanGAP) involved in mRNA processing and transport
VDVEIASAPKYYDDDEPAAPVPAPEKKDPNLKAQKKKMTERSEGEALKHPHEVEEEKETLGVVTATGEKVPKEPPAEGTEPEKPEHKTEAKPEEANGAASTKKKEKKKRSEEERKARKERKRRLAEENGQIPVELTRNASDSSDLSPVERPKSSASPTTDPLRIYRRCCQLRETSILKKITEQLAAQAAAAEKPGVVGRLDLTDCWLTLPDLVTLGDYLAVVPVKELVMENCGLTDEGVRVILAGLLAASPPDMNRFRRKGPRPTEVVSKHGVIQRLVLKNNTKIGKEGWRHISCFIHMCRSLKYLDLSLIPFPQPKENTPSTPSAKPVKEPVDPAVVLSKALAQRLGGPELELLNMADTNLNTSQIGLIVDGVINCGIKRLGLAENHISPEGLQHVARYLRECACEGLDLGGNDIVDSVEVIAEALDAVEGHPLLALSLAHCNLTPEALWKLFPSLAKLKNFRFIDLSHNHDIFDIRPSAVYLLRKYLPKMPILKRIHLTDCNITAEQAIALAEIFPDAAGLAHVNLLENPELSKLANATDEAGMEEACALYASLMAAVRVSKTIICIDIDVPSAESSEVVKALAKQVVAHSLRNMERGPVAEIAEAAGADLVDDGDADLEVEMPEILQHLVGPRHATNADAVMVDDDNEPAPDEDYVIGGTGLVKALDICLKNRNSDSRRPSIDRKMSEAEALKSGVEATQEEARENKKREGKAKDMSKNLLGSARKIRARLQPALVREERSGDSANYSKSTLMQANSMCVTNPSPVKLLFLDQTLERMIKRFEDEYPETRLNAQPSSTSSAAAHTDAASPSEGSVLSSVETAGAAMLFAHDEAEPDHGYGEVLVSDDEEVGIRPMLSRHNSDVSLASRALSLEEGRMHRFGQKFRREIIKSDIETDFSVLDTDAASSAADQSGPQTPATPSSNHPLRMLADEKQVPWDNAQMLRAMVQEMGGEELKRRIVEGGEDAVMTALMSEEAKALRDKLRQDDPEGWERFRHAQELAMRNAAASQSEVAGNADSAVM